MAKNLTVNVLLNVSIKNAVAARQAENGDSIVELKKEQLDQLSDGEISTLLGMPAIENKQLGAYIDLTNLDHPYSKAVSVSQFGFEGVRDALALIVKMRKDIEDESKQKKEKEELERKAEINKLLNTATEKLITIEYGCYHSEYTITNSFKEFADAPEMKEKAAEVFAEIKRRNQKLRDEEVEKRAKKEAEEKKRKDAKNKEEELKKQQEQQVADFALAGHAGDTAQRAAKEGYDITGLVTQAIAAQLPQPSATSVDGDDYAWSVRANPFAHAFEVFDTLTEKVKSVNKPECMTLTVSKIMRIETPDRDSFGNRGMSEKHTGVVVKIDSPVTKTLYLLYYADQCEADNDE